MNLLEDAWLPVRQRDGQRRWVAPQALSDPDIVAFDADRADFNGALAQFAIGLLQTTTPADSAAWRRWFGDPPDAATLREWFAPVAHAFEFDGEGARFMQDRSLADGTCVDIAGLLIEAPGENAVKNNGDHFVKRGHVRQLCPRCAATALLTLQINAPAGGAGHRTGLRGGGPLTTLVASRPARSLWHDLWLNVRERSAFLDGGGDPAMTEAHFSFPWLADIGAIQKEGGETAPVQVHPVHVFWAMPRRIRLDLDSMAEGVCDVCGEQSERLIQRYSTKNYGLNYKGAWNHPLSPYYEANGAWLPLHPQPGGFGYRHWLGWVMGLSSEKKQQRRASAVDHVLVSRSRQIDGALCLWAFGFDMDNMKPRCWYESTLPLYGLADCDATAQRAVEASVAEWLAAAEMAAFDLRGAVKDAWFGGDPRGEFSMIDASFWSRTEPQFYRLLGQRIEALRRGGEFDVQKENEAWLLALGHCALSLFDGVFVGAGPIERQHPRRVALAHRRLRSSLFGARMHETLRLPVSDAGAAKKARKARARKSPQDKNAQESQ